MAAERTTGNASGKAPDIQRVPTGRRGKAVSLARSALEPVTRVVVPPPPPAADRRSAARLLAAVMTGELGVTELEAIERGRAALARASRADEAAPGQGEYARAVITEGVSVSRDERGLTAVARAKSWGANARPIWSVGIAQPLRETGARYGALVQSLEAPGLGAMDFAAIRVEGGGGRNVCPADRVHLRNRLERAWHSIGDDMVFEARAARDDVSLPDPALSVRALVDGICVSEHSLATILRLSGREPKGRTQQTAVRALAAALGRLADAGV